MKVAICIPVYGMTHAKFTHSLANLITYSLSHATIEVERGGEREEVALELDTFMVSCSMLTESRHKLVAEATVWGADYMLWMDADHVFPPNALMRLLAHGLPVVGCNYPRRITPTAPTAAAALKEDQKDAGLLYTTKEKAEAELVEECRHLGFGLVLMDMRIFDAMQAHAEQEGEGNFLPLFWFEPAENKMGMIGEDVFFFAKLARAGIRPFVDHGLSWEVGHLHEVILTNAHAVQHQGAWDEAWKERRDRYEAKAREIEAKEAA